MGCNPSVIRGGSKSGSPTAAAAKPITFAKSFSQARSSARTGASAGARISRNASTAGNISKKLYGSGTLQSIIEEN